MLALQLGLIREQISMEELTSMEVLTSMEERP
jgi:hypothetical protein